jgi:Putative Actinobacterial Holin-X, holin superfamily III
MADQDSNGDPALKDRSTSELVSQLSEQASTLIRQELDLAKAELAQKGKQAGIGAGFFGTAGLFGLVGFAVVTAALILLLDNAIADWVAALIVGALYLAVAAAAALRGRDRVREAAPLEPEQTIETLKEDAQWAKSQARSGGR